MDDLKVWVLKNLININWVEFDEMSDLSLDQLQQLKCLVESAIEEMGGE